MDSTVCAAIAHSEFYDIHALHINYGQKLKPEKNNPLMIFVAIIQLIIVYMST